MVAEGPRRCARSLLGNGYVILDSSNLTLCPERGGFLSISGDFTPFSGICTVDMGRSTKVPPTEQIPKRAWLTRDRDHSIAVLKPLTIVGNQLGASPIKICSGVILRGYHGGRRQDSVTSVDPD